MLGEAIKLKTGSVPDSEAPMAAVAGLAERIAPSAEKSGADMLI
jgi:hypothetical protein